MRRCHGRAVRGANNEVAQPTNPLSVSLRLSLSVSLLARGRLRAMRFDGAIAPTPRAALPPLPGGQYLKLDAPGLVKGLGGKLWPSSAALCRWLRNEQLQGKSVFELGCGCGAVGLYAAALGASNVMLTDGGGDALLETTAGNMGRNHRLLTNSEVSVKSHSWGERDVKLPPRIDYVLGADVTYSRQSHKQLCKSIRWLVDERSPRVVLAHEHRMLRDAASESETEDVGLVHFCEMALASRLQVAMICTEAQDGTVSEPVTDAEWTDHLLVRGASISLLEITPT